MPPRPVSSPKRRKYSRVATTLATNGIPPHGTRWQVVLCGPSGAKHPTLALILLVIRHHAQPHAAARRHSEPIGIVDMIEALTANGLWPRSFVENPTVR